MMADKRDDGAWFAPKTYGYGAGLPIAWQGWAMLAGHVAAILPGVVMAKASPAAAAAWMPLAALLPLPIYKARTRGGWKWRWG